VTPAPERPDPEFAYAPHGHRLPEVDHEPVTWHYKDGCTVEVHEDGSHTFTPFYAAAPAPDAGLDVGRLRQAMSNCLPPPWADQFREVAAEYAALSRQAGEGDGMSDHALHFDPDCEECVYLARPTVVRAPAPDPDRAVESIAYMGTIDIRQQVCAWCGERYGVPHRQSCPLIAQEPALRAALSRQAEKETA
jgi:hypothetical protein